MKRQSNRYNNVSGLEWPEPRPRPLSHKCELDDPNSFGTNSFRMYFWLRDELVSESDFGIIWWDGSE